MRKVILRMKEQDKYNVIKELVDHGGNKKRAALNLGLTVRQINRLINKYKEQGKSGFIHGNRSKKPAKTLDKSISETVILLYKNKYYDFNFMHFYDYLLEEEKINVSYTFVYTTLMNAGIRSPRARRATKRRLDKEKLQKEKKLKNKSEEEIEIIVNNEIANEVKNVQKISSKRIRKSISRNIEKETVEIFKMLRYFEGSTISKSK